MHGSAHDEAQRQRYVLVRCGKCVQRALRGVVTRLRTRRTLVAAVALVLLVLALLALCHAQLLSQRPAHRDGAHDNATADAVADDSTSRVAASPTDRWLLRPDTQHGGSVRVMLLMVSTRVNEQLCYALASAYFADLPVVVVGFGVRYKSHIWRWQVYLDAIERAGLRDRDVVLLLDSDILFSGEGMLPFIDDYIARSPAAPSALDVRAVRAGTAQAPSLFESQYACFAPQTYGIDSLCGSRVAQRTKIINKYIARTGVAYALLNYTTNPFQYLNGGVSIHRVWSVRELTKIMQQYVAKHKPPMKTNALWYDDQSVLALLYNRLRVHEAKLDMLRNNTAAATQRGPYGLRAGQIQIDYTGQLSTGVNHEPACPLQLTDELWRNDAALELHTRLLVYANTSQYVAKVYERYGDSVRLQQRTLTRAGSRMQNVYLAPSLLSLLPRQIFSMSQPATRVYPYILHIHGKYKEERTKRVLHSLPWYTPIYHNATRRQQQRAHCVASLIELWTMKNMTRCVRYGDACRVHPYDHTANT